MLLEAIVFGVLERKVEERRLQRVNGFVEPLRDCLKRNLARERIEFKGSGAISENISRKLIDSQNQRERGSSVPAP